VGFKKMFAPANVKAAEITSRPEFGAIHTISARYPQTLPPEEDRGDAWKMLGFLDHMVHPYSVLRLLGGSIEHLRVERHEASGATFTSLRFRSGAIGSLLLSTSRAGVAPLERTEIVGDGGTVVVENNLRVTYYRAGPPPGPYGRTASYYAEDATAPLHWEPEFSLGQLYNKGMFLLGYVPEVIAFCEAALEGRVPEKGNLEDALEILRIYEAYREAEGKRVDLPSQ
jgi:predicted dehydrogenase